MSYTTPKLIINGFDCLDCMYIGLMRQLAAEWALPWIKGDDANRTKVVCSQKDKDQASVNSPSPSAEVTHSQIREKKNREKQPKADNLSLLWLYSTAIIFLWYYEESDIKQMAN